MLGEYGGQALGAGSYLVVRGASKASRNAGRVVGWGWNARYGVHFWVLFRQVGRVGLAGVVVGRWCGVLPGVSCTGRISSKQTELWGRKLSPGFGL